MRTQLSNNIVSSHVPMFVMASSVLVFKEVYQRTNFSYITYKASSGMEGERFFGLTGICIDL